ncbi:MAG TPA: PBP1A family penicillin-binding protein [Tissierellia bacterium]|nr:PBP1A family penicillin-binding protein [Tissierellia bacterium]
MSEHNKKKTKQNMKKGLKILFITLFMAGAILAGTVSGIALAIIAEAPEINPSNISSLLTQTSFILDEKGNVLEKIQTEEYRTIVSIDKMPKHLKDAFIAIEDERFEKHIGVDIIGIIKSAYDNLKAGEIVRGGSTITQQLARNIYLTLDQNWTRKIQEAYLAIQIEQELTKDQILEAYLNRIYLGQGAYGVQSAAETYFSKDVQDLTLAESAVLAAIVQSPSRYGLYQTIRPEDFDSQKHIEVGEVDIFGEKYIAVYNERAVERQKLVLAKMLELGKITEEEYNTAINEDILSKIKPGQKKVQGISSYFNDFVKTQVIEALIEKLGYTREQAERELYTGGLKIYSTMDLELQKKLEDIYDNFTEYLLGDVNKINAPALISWKRDKSGNILDENNNVIFYSQQNLLDEEFNLIVEANKFEFVDGNLVLKSNKFSTYNNVIDIADYYNIDENKNLVTYRMGNLSLPENAYTIGEDKSITINKSYLEDNKDFCSVNSDGNLIINSKYFYRQKDGIVQPQSAAVIMDYRTGQIKALVGGRDVEGTRILNRATSSPRQPGSTIKPLAVYMPALDNGYTAATTIDDIPFYVDGKLWPSNWYTGYRGIHTLRQSVEQSVNVNSVKTLQSIGIKTSMEYLSKMGIINVENPEKDNFITSAENRVSNDENLSALGLGGMTKGLTPLEMTAAYGTIANLGTYIEPISFTKVLDKDGHVLIDNTPKKNAVVSPEVAYIMSDILRTTVSNGIAGRAQVPNMPTAGKTGTTQDQSDAWFVGYTHYYAAGIWIGNDSPQIKLSRSSSVAADLWKIVMTQVHEGLEPKDFERPDNLITLSICTKSGKLATELCKKDPRGSTIRSEIFVRGTQPTDFCDVHVELDIDTTTNKIANEYCPKENVEKRVFIKRNPPYDPEANNGIVPSDYQYTAPTEVCDVHTESKSIIDWLEDWFNNPGGNDGDKDWNNDDNENEDSNRRNDNRNNNGKKNDNKENNNDNRDNGNGN